MNKEEVNKLSEMSPIENLSMKEQLSLIKTIKKSSETKQLKEKIISIKEDIIKRILI